MASLREGFEHFYPPDDEAIAVALRTGLVSVDTNVLLNLYRFQAEAREQLFGVLELIGDRLWIPHQVALEFHRNRLGVIADQESYFNKTGESMDAAVNEYLSRLRAFTKRVALSPASADELEDMIRKAHQAVKDQVSAAGRANEIHLDNRDSDEVLRRLETLFTGRVGEPMTSAELEAARKEAKRRADATPKIPPGYMDKDKPDGSGDYLLWRQLINEARQRTLPVILITEDRKEDWIWREHGQTLGARYELREEMQTEAGVPFLLMTTETFLIQAANYLEITVSPQTVSQAKGLTESAAERSPIKWQIDNTMRSIAATELELDVIDRELATSHQLVDHLTFRFIVLKDLTVREEVHEARQEIDRLTGKRRELKSRLSKERQSLQALQQAGSEIISSTHAGVAWNDDPPGSARLFPGTGCARVSPRAVSRDMPRAGSAAGCHLRRAGPAHPPASPASTSTPPNTRVTSTMPWG